MYIIHERLPYEYHPEYDCDALVVAFRREEWKR